MKREIKFRGKRLDNGEWVVGDLIHKNNGDVAIRTYLNVWVDNSDDIDAYGEEFIINPATVGQYTGLKDKNGKEVWEGDIVDAWSAGSHLPNGIIKWGALGCSFFIGTHTNSCCWKLSGNNKGHETFEIIGNIHDHPELLKQN